ncbi:MAG: hypothetical protein MJ102_06885 [Clostridia bacterium]|nr:hypothetical protein [Clostridia bacterium]
MTTKELLYVEDALGHQQIFIDKCRETAQKLEDTELRAYVEEMSSRQSEIFKKFYGLL